MITNWESEQDAYYETVERQSYEERNVNDLCWFKMDQFQSKVLNVDIDGTSEEGTDGKWNEIKAKYLDSEFNAQCDLLTMNNSLLRKMGSAVQVICLLGSEQSFYGESMLHLTGMWLNKFGNQNGDGDRVLLYGQNKTMMDGLKDAESQQAFLVHEESWDLMQQYSIDKDTIFVAGICDTEQRIQSHLGEKLSVPNVPTVIRIKTQIQMALSKQQ